MQRPRTPSRISDSLYQRLNSYARAASAAGVSALAPPAGYFLATGTALAGVFAFTEPAEARIVYTRADKNISCHATSGGCFGTFNLNLNNNKRADFQLLCYAIHGPANALQVTPVDSVNRVWTTSSHYKGYAAAALYKGAVIQSGSHFQKEGLLYMFGSTGGYYRGPWLSVQNRYLGLKFLIKGKVHYGWARLSTYLGSSHFATLTGYAYETTPNKPIIAGKTKGPDVVTLEPASLGHLARGASAIPAWRRTNSVVATH